MLLLHKPTNGQVFGIIATSSTAIPDMRTVTSAVLELRGPSGTAHAITATLGTATASAVQVTSAAIDPTLGEASAQEIGTYELWAVLTAGELTYKANNNPLQFRIVEDWENTK